jgi:hypothetical protein
VCTAGRCKSACGGTGDYCNAAPNVVTNSCNNCLTTYFATGAACDNGPGTALDSQCQANAECAAYNTCANGCP